MAKRVLLHVGAPKTGTSFVQDILFKHAETLRTQGILYPAARFDEHFIAALDLMQLPWGGIEKQAVGAWDRMAADVRSWPGTAIISHEILGRASRPQVARALESLGGPDTEIHLLLSARDLVRQIPAEWQENLKHRREMTYGSFLADLVDEQRSSEIGQWFWSVQEVPDVLDRWAETLPRERVHLVTVPPPGAPKDLLWQRFAGVLGIDPQEFQPSSERVNSSLGVAEAALLRRLNVALKDVVHNHNYRPLVREYLVHRNLSANPSAVRLSLPPETFEWAAQLSRLWVAELALRGYDVVGDLSELLPSEPAGFVDPDHADDAAIAEAGVLALCAMTAEAARLRELTAKQEAIIGDLMGQLDKHHATRTYKAKEKLVGQAQSNPVAKAGLRAYRGLRARNSRST